MLTFELNEEVSGVVGGGGGELDVYNVGLRRVDEFLALLFVSATDDHVARCRRLSDLRVDVAQFIFTARWSFRVVLLQPPRSLCRRPAAADKLIILRIQARNQPSDNGGGLVLIFWTFFGVQKLEFAVAVYGNIDFCLSNAMQHFLPTRLQVRPLNGFLQLIA